MSPTDDDAFEYVDSVGVKDCPACDAPVALTAVRCSDCGVAFEQPKHKKGLNGLVIGAGCSLLWVGLGGVPFVFVFSQAGWPQRVVPLLLLSLGSLSATVMIVLAWFDLRGISTGRLNPVRRTGTIIGLWLAGFSLVLHAAAVAIAFGPIL